MAAEFCCAAVIFIHFLWQFGGPYPPAVTHNPIMHVFSLFLLLLIVTCEKSANVDYMLECSSVCTSVPDLTTARAIPFSAV